MTTYTGANIQDLEAIHPLEPIRRLPGMYIGNNSIYGLHHLVFEAIDNSIDEILNGYGQQVIVTIYKDGSLSVEDDGRGIPVDHNGQMSALTLALTKRHAGGKFRGEGEQDAYLSGSGGLHGIGIKATNAFSEWLVVEVKRHGLIFRQRFEQGGTPITAVEIESDGQVVAEVGPKTKWQLDKSGVIKKLTIGRKQVAVKPQKKLGSGTRLHFRPHRPWFDRTMEWPKGTVPWDFNRLETRLQQLAHLHPGVRIELHDLRGHRKEHKHRLFESKRGLLDYIAALNVDLTPLHKPIHFSGTQEVTAQNGSNGNTDRLGTMTIEVVIQYAGDERTIISFVNSIPTPQGGTAVSGFQAGLTKAVNQFGSDKKLLKQGNIRGDDLQLGLTAIVNVTMTMTPQFSSQTKEQLTTSEAQGIAASITYEHLLAYLSKNIPVGKAIIAQAEAAARGREAAKAARQLIIRKSALEVSELPGKLADVARNAVTDETMLFIVEGDSAGGSCKQARDRRHHAILPLRGKIPNTEGLAVSRMIGNRGNAEIKALVSAIGGGIGRDFDVEKMRYGGVAILTDADVDGEHIRTLLFTFFWRHMRPMVEAGRLYLANPPLYLLAKGQKRRYAYTPDERDEILAQWGKAGVHIQRYKGLGEMNPDQLRNTVFALKNGHPLNDHLQQVVVDDAHHTGQVMGTLMGKAVKPRRVWLFQTWRGENEAVEETEEEDNGDN